MGFNNILGNEKVKKYLTKDIENSSIVHSYIFSGIESIGKLLFAKEFANNILCLNNRLENCNCKSCLCFKSENHPDFEIINEEGQTIKIEQIRLLTNKIIEKPIISNKKIYIINDAEKMTKEAQNCLLKTLEAPPEFAVLILITSNINLLLNTVVSRCINISFEKISNEQLYKFCKENLGYIDLDDTLLQSFNGSIGKAIEYKENENEYKLIQDTINNLNKILIINLLNNLKPIYNKEKIYNYLNYMTTCIYEKTKENKKYLNCINYITETISKIKMNGNLDMNIDMLLIKMWEEVN